MSKRHCFVFKDYMTHLLASRQVPYRLEMQTLNQFSVHFFLKAQPELVLGYAVKCSGQ